LVGGGAAAAVLIVAVVLLRNDETPRRATVRDITTQASVLDTSPQATLTDVTTQPSVSEGSPAGATTEWTAPAAGDVVTNQDSAVQSLTGYWDGDWGQIVIQVGDDGAATAAYEYDDGFIVGTVTDGVLSGTWCEAPSYSGTNDAGLVQMRIVETGDVPSIDGRWIYGTDPSAGWSENWDVTGKSTEDEPQELRDRLPQASATCVDVS